ncbi:MAG: hypothetical protein IKJ23_06405 [Bacteroidaceae bacterium]|nr:hypothetical protein [Bacteroidaceae bacterium]
MEEKRMNEAESLELITSMINDSRARMTKNLGTPFLIWGYTTVAVSICQAVIVACVEEFYPYLWGWFAIPVVGWLLMLLFNKQEKTVTNYIDRCINALWCAIGVAAFILPFMGVFVFPSVIMLIGVGTATTAAVVKDKIVKRIGYAAIFSSLLFPFVRVLLSRLFTLEQFAGRERYLVECIIFAVIMFLLLVVSGHILNYKKRCLKS